MKPSLPGRAAAVAAAGAAARKVPAAPGVAYTVTTQSTKDETGIQTLVGDYTEKGSNHNKKVYQKMQKIAGHEDVKVFLYYWDQRDGPDFSGWWFGDQVGGSQVWARCPSHGPSPPRVGWRIPWDSPKAEPGVLSVDPAGAGAAAPAAASAPAGQPMTLQARVKKATDQIEAVEVTANEAVSTSKAVTTGGLPAAGALQELMKAQSALQEVQKSLTQDITEARRSGPTATGIVTELSKLSPRLRVLQTALGGEVARMKPLAAKAGGGGMVPQKTATAAVIDSAAMKAQEEKDSKEMQESLPAMKELVGSADEAVEAVTAMAAPLVAEPPEDAEVLSAATGEIEGAANEAQEKITEARKQINMKLQAARKYAPETRKAALTEFSGLQQKLTEGQKKLNPYKTFKKEFQARVVARKALMETSEKIASAELEVEKAKMMSAAASQGQMTEEELAAVDKVLQPVKALVETSLRAIDTKMRTADGAMKDELSQLRDKAMGYKTEVDAVATVLRGQRERLTTKDMLKVASEKVDAVEEALNKCQEAEMPFLKGLEVLPAEESAKAITDSEAAVQKAEGLATQTKGFVRAKLTEAKRYVKELATSVTEELTAHQARLDGLMEKVANFKKETVERKMAALMAEVVDQLSPCEKKVAALAKAVEVFESETLESISVDALKEALEKAATAEQAASAAMLEVRKVYAEKQKSAKGPDAASALAKVQQRINTTQKDLATAKKSAGSAEKLIKCKEVQTEEEAKIKDIEEQVSKAERKVKPSEEEKAMGVESAKPSDEEVEDMTTKLMAAQATLKASQRALDASIAGAPASSKDCLQKLVARCKATQTTIVEVMALTKDQRERVMSDLYVRQGKAKADEIDKAMEKVDEAELPFLKGVEVLPLQETNAAMTASDAASAEVQGAINAARSFIAAKNVEVKKYGAEASKPAAEEFTQLTERINAAASKLAQFKRETDARKKTANMQEAGEKMTGVEACIKKLAEATEPFAKEGEDDFAEEEVEKLVVQLKAAEAAVDETKKFLSARQADVKGNSAQEETLKDFQSRMKEALMELQKHKKVASKHEQKYTAKKVLADANEKLEEIEKEVKKATDFCAPLLEEGGLRFLVGASVRTLAAAYRDQMKSKSLTQEALFSEVAGGSSGISKDAFLAHLEKLPEQLSRDELSFDEVRRQQIFKHIDKDADDKISQDEFKDIFNQKFICTKEVSVTDSFDVSASKTVFKIQPGDMLESTSNQEADANTGMSRIECSVPSAGKTGFVTVQGGQGTKFIELISPFSTFCKELDKNLDESAKVISSLCAAYNAKAAELNSPGKEGPLAEARAELGKSRPKAAGFQATVSKLRASIAAAKKEYAKKEAAEKNAHIEARERKEADAVVAPVVAKVEAVEAALKRLEAAVEPILSISGDELDAFATPLSLLESAEKIAEEVVKFAEETKAAVTTQSGELPKVLKGAMMDAKRELAKMSSKADLAKRKCSTKLDGVRNKLGAIVEARLAQVSSEMRTQMQGKGTSVDKYFLELAAPSTDKISEEAFCRRVQALLGEAYRAEQISMMCKHIEDGGICRRRFQGFLQQYFAVVKGIAITNDFAISTATTLRKAELDEIFELVAGPKIDESSGVTRMKGRSLVDGREGWITLMGNQGSCFLQEVEKPYFVCQADAPLEKEFKADGDAGSLRTVKADEVLELIEGPRKVELSPGLRVKGKAVSDGALGWFTVKDKNGTVFAEADIKYYSCTSSVAMTDNQDIKDCKVLRKLAVGELFTLEEGPIEETDAGVTRVKGKALKDDIVGWITTKGNAGTVYAEPSTKHFCVLKEVPLTKKFPSGDCGEEVRKLEKGEAVQGLEGPKEEVHAPEIRVRVKAVADGVEGWLTKTKANMKPWTPHYTCKVATPLHEGLAVEGATVVREAGAGEKFELLEGPTEHEGVLRMKAQSEKDDAVGFVTIRDKDGKRFFES